MRQEDVLVKWTGSKRLQADEILARFPESIDTYYEPFLGGGSVLYVLTGSQIPVRKIECGDINESLIGIWNLILHDPEKLFDFYASRWPFDKDAYYSLRAEYNETPDPLTFFCLLRTCRNGLVRYNLKGKFTSAFHEKRKGIQPKRLRPILDDWHARLSRHDVTFKAGSYADIASAEGDFLYLDPPYAKQSNDLFYFGAFDFNGFWSWLRRQQGGYALSLNGEIGGKDCTVEVPTDLYYIHHLTAPARSKFKQLVGEDVASRHSLYLKAAS